MPKFVVWFWPLHHQTAFHYITFFLLLSFCGSRVPTGFAFWEVYHRKQPLYWTYSWKTIEVRQRHQEVFQTQICFSLSLLVQLDLSFQFWSCFPAEWSLQIVESANSLTEARQEAQMSKFELMIRAVTAEEMRAWLEDQGKETSKGINLAFGCKIFEVWLNLHNMALAFTSYEIFSIYLHCM